MSKWILVSLALALTACGPTVCVGTSCICPTGQTCAFDGCTASTSGCSLDCGATATCTGSCGAACNVNCSGTECTHTVGAGANVVCGAGKCNITCEGACSVASTGALTLTCKVGSKTAAGCQ